ncbi:MAG: MarR family transcriptional regulator [Anaerolineae bacterium]
MNPKRDAAVNAIIQSQKAVFHSIWETITGEWLHLDLTMGQVKVLFALCHTGPTSMGGVADKLQIGLPAASVLVDKMVQTQLVERHEDPEDRRRTLVRLTAQGDKLAQHLREGRRELMRDWLDELSEPDLAALERGLGALAQVAAPTHAGIKK